VRVINLFNQILTDPDRSRGWKILDVTVLGVLWSGVIVIGIAMIANSVFEPLFVIWAGVTGIASARSWYLHPSGRRRPSAPPLFHSMSANGPESLR
jgi:hypothetical protein